MIWSAKWIWGNSGSMDKNSWICFRKTFIIKEEYDSTILRISADSRYLLYVNGLLIGTGPLRCWPFEQSYDSFEIKNKLKKGLNLIAVLVNHYGTSTSQYVQGRGGLIAQADFYSDGCINNSIFTCDDWVSLVHMGYDRNVCRINVAQPWMEVYDARAFDEGWIYPDFDDSTWEKSFVIGSSGTEPWNKLIERDIPPLASEEKYASRIVSHKMVKPIGQHRCVDIRSNFFPDSYDSIDKKLLGYLVSVIVSPCKMTGKIRLICRKWPETEERIKLNGKEYIFASYEDVKEVILESGKNLLMMDISGYHQRFTMNYHYDFCEKIEFLAPIFGKPYEFVTIGPFETGDILNIVVVDNPLDYKNMEYCEVWKLKSEEDLATFLKWMKPVSEVSVMHENSQILSMITDSSDKINITNNICNMITPNDMPAVIFPSRISDTEIIIDFGKELSAFFTLDVESQAGAIIDMVFVESIHNDIIEYSPDLNNAARYITKKGRQQYRSHLRRGFRYLVITLRNLSEPIKVFNIKAYQSNYPVSQIGSFKCSDWLLNEIWNISSYSVLLCMEDTFVDCPAYEQAYWIGDARNEALIGYYTFGAYDLMKRCIRLAAGALHYSELPAAQVPTGCDTVITAWVLLWIIACKEYYDFSGDLDGIVRIYPDILKCINNLLKHLNENCLLEINGWNMLDWAGMDTPPNGVITHQCALLAKALADTAYISGKMGDVSNEVEFNQKAISIKNAINKYLWDDTRKAFIDSIHDDGKRSSVISMQTNIMLYLCNCVDDDKKVVIERYLIDMPSEFVQIGSPFMSFFYFEALSKIDRVDIILQKIREGWGEMLKYDATTCWETFPGVEKKRLTRSHCHGWSAAPGYFLGSCVLGIKPLTAGFEEIIIQPEPCGLQWAKGSVPTPLGPVHVEWSITEGNFHIEVDVPKGCRYSIRLPECKMNEMEMKGDLT